MNEMMKDSGIAWIGKIPEHWKITKIKYSTELRNEQEFYNKTSKFIALENVSTYSGKYIETDSEYDEERYDVYKKGDLLFSKLRPYLAKALIASDDGYCTGEFAIIKKFDGDIRYLFFYLLSDGCLSIINASTYGTKMPRASWNYISNLCIPIINFTEQQAIAYFLDSACAKIDGIIADLEHQVDLLKEYKKSLITETVTKGLDKHVKLKDSGIAWIGKIPEHWEVTRLKYISKFKTGGTPDDKSGINTENDGFPWITAPDITDSLDIRNYSQYITDKSVKLHRYSLFPANSILLVCIASVGKIGMLHEYGYANQQITAIMSNNCILPRYLLFYLNSVATKISADASSNVVPIINTRYLSNISVILPSLEQQQDIASFLDTRCAEVDSIIKGKEEQIEQQKEYKKSLIYEYVTGKKRVKEVE